MCVIQIFATLNFYLLPFTFCLLPSRRATDKISRNGRRHTRRLAQVREQIALAAERAGRRSEEITLIAVSKTFDSSTVQRAVDAGALDLGENRVQEAASKVETVKGERLRWHLIGHLQSNKARLAVRAFDVIHTIDSRELAERLDRIAGEEGRSLRCRAG